LTYSEGIAINHVVYQIFAGDTLWNEREGGEREGGESDDGAEAEKGTRGNVFNKTGNFDVWMALKC
jgi:hypothetical protein